MICHAQNSQDNIAQQEKNPLVNSDHCTTASKTQGLADGQFQPSLSF